MTNEKNELQYQMEICTLLLQKQLQNGFFRVMTVAHTGSKAWCPTALDLNAKVTFLCTVPRSIQSSSTQHSKLSIWTKRVSSLEYSLPTLFFFFFLSHPMLSIYTHAQVSRNSRQQRYPDNNNSSQMSTHKPNEIQYFLCCWCIFLHSLFCPTTVILLQKKKGRFCLFKLQNFCFSKLKSLLLLRVCHLQNYILLWCMQI